ncbi:unnamed protein product [Ambrosiozyma monospora]|uniref:Unnamed protein product n=1 Tax=Ambrosiozyma monospora TaxID=43982 RepID=A0ACB5TF97_AMBMO|nr:unnamed protein product [Ambrosiozyma monospora]
MIRVKMNKGEYDNFSQGVWQFKKDMYKVFSNGQLYYEDNSHNFRLAQTLHGFFKKKMEKFKETYPNYRDDEPGSNNANITEQIVQGGLNEFDESRAKSVGANGIEDLSIADPEEISNNTLHGSVAPSEMLTLSDEVPNFIRKHDIEKVEEVAEIDDISAYIKKFTFSSAIKQYNAYLPDSQFFEYCFLEPSGNSTVGGTTYSINLSSAQVIGQSLLILVSLQNRIIDEKYITELKVNNDVLKPQPISISYDQDNKNSDFLACKFEFKLSHGLNLLEFKLKVPFPLTTNPFKTPILEQDPLLNFDGASGTDGRLTRSSRSSKKQDSDGRATHGENGCHTGTQEFIQETVKVWVNVSQ